MGSVKLAAVQGIVSVKPEALLPLAGGTAAPHEDPGPVAALGARSQLHRRRARHHRRTRRSHHLRRSSRGAGHPRRVHARTRRHDPGPERRRAPRALTGRYVKSGPGASPRVLAILRTKIEERLKLKELLGENSHLYFGALKQQKMKPKNVANLSRPTMGPF